MWNTCSNTCCYKTTVNSGVPVKHFFRRGGIFINSLENSYYKFIIKKIIVEIINRFIILQNPSFFFYCQHTYQWLHQIEWLYVMCGKKSSWMGENSPIAPPLKYWVDCRCYACVLYCECRTFLTITLNNLHNFYKNLSYILCDFQQNERSKVKNTCLTIKCRFN